MRSIWSGSISFGLINIPIKIYSASEERALQFKMLEKHEHCPISYVRVCRETGKEVPYRDIVKGYEYQKGEFVILTDDDFAKVAPKKTKTIDIVNFAKEDEIPSTHISRPYYIEPEKKAAKAYVLLREALKRSGNVGVATWVLRNKEHLAMLRPEGDALMLIELRYSEDVRSPEDLHIPEGAKYTKAELDMALMLIKQLEAHFDAREYKDTYTAELKKIIAKKAKGKPIRVGKAEEPQATDMRDLMEALRQSLEQEKRSSKSAERRPEPARV
jgi:DNA end-binding protein Ku